MPSLYALTAEYQAAADKLADLDMDAQTIADTLDGLSGDVEEKWKNTIFVAKNIEAAASARYAAAAAMKESADKEMKQVSALKQRVLDSMALLQRQKVDCVYFKLAIRENPPSLFIDDEASIPQAYWRDPEPLPEPSRYVDKAVLKDALKAGAVIPGAHVERGTRLEIK